MLQHPRAHFFAQRLKVGGGGVAVIGGSPVTCATICGAVGAPSTNNFTLSLRS